MWPGAMLPHHLHRSSQSAHGLLDDERLHRWLCPGQIDVNGNPVLVVIIAVEFHVLTKRHPPEQGFLQQRVAPFLRDGL